MPTEVFDDAIDLQVGLLEADRPRPGDSSYPWPALRATDGQEMRRFRTVVLENAFLRVTVVPALGGRILSLLDLRTGQEVLRRRKALMPVAGGSRGVYLPDGIRFGYGPLDRPNSLGNVETSVDGEGVWVSETVSGNGLGFHLRIELPDDQAVVRLEARVFNRSLEAVAYDGGWTFGMGESRALVVDGGVGLFNPVRDAQLAVLWPGEVFDGLERIEDEVRISRFGQAGVLAPRQTDAFTFVLVPATGLGGLSGASEAGLVHLAANGLRIQATEDRPGHRLFLGLVDGQTLEAPADLGAAQVHVVDLDGLPSAPAIVLARDASKRDVLTGRADPPEARPGTPRPPRWDDPGIGLETSDDDLGRATLDAGARGLAWTLLGMRAMAGGEFAEAGDAFERALMFNADDVLAWWAKAACNRLAGGDGEGPELPNAHYLAPLEPILRAEAFLNQGVPEGHDASPLLAPLAENPETFVEVACILLEHGLLKDASRWIDEALRHRDLPMLHVLQAFALSEGTRMAADAALHIQRAGPGAEPPHPFRAIEWRAIRALGLEAWAGA